MKKNIWLLIIGVAVIIAFTSSTDAQSCMKDSDCESGQICITSSDSDGEQEGECKVQPILCDDDDDCPEGLSCTEQEASACEDSFEGTSSCESSSTTKESVCRYNVLNCENDDECFEDYACTNMGGLEECTNAGCSPVENKICYPKRIDCVNNEDCENDWSCYTYPSLSESTRQSAPPGWEDVVSVCFPDGIILALEGQVPVGVSKDAKSEEQNKLSTGNSTAENSGCTVGTAFVGSKVSPLLLMAAILLLLKSRRRKLLRCC